MGLLGCSLHIPGSSALNTLFPTECCVLGPKLQLLFRAFGYSFIHLFIHQSRGIFDLTNTMLTNMRKMLVDPALKGDMCTNR